MSNKKLVPQVGGVQGNLVEKEQTFRSKPHKKLVAWQKSMRLVEKIYDLTRRFPREELYGLTSQLRRAAVSVPSKVAEGAAGRSLIQFRNYLSVAIGSLNEVATQLEIAQRIGYLNVTTFAETESLVDECLAVTYGRGRVFASG